MRLAATVAALLFVLPFAALIVRAPWGRMWDIASARSTVEPLALSLIVGIAAVIVSVIVGLPLAWVLARGRSRVMRLLRGAITVPMVLPPVVAGLSLLMAFGSRGVFGAPLQALGVSLPFSLAGAVLAAAFVSAPFLIFSLEAGFSTIDPELEDAARTLGAGEVRVLRTVTLPALRPAFVAGAALTFARALGEFGATITFAGNVRGRTQTAPLAVFELFQSDPDAAVMLSIITLVLSFGSIVFLREKVLAR